jgi:hypothetical protein
MRLKLDNVFMGIRFLMRVFFGSCVSVVSRRHALLVVLNAVYFGSILVATILVEARILPYYELSVVEGGFPEQVGDLPLMFLFIFLFSLFVSGLLLTTLTGLVFFILPVVILVLRATLWGAILNQLPTPQFLASLPTLVLEGEGYVVACVAGMGLGLAWLKPSWMYEGEVFSRVEAFKAALREALCLYVWVGMFLLVSALVEAMTMALMLGA